MPRVTIQVGGRERLHPTISKGTLLLPTDALVWIGATCISGTATAMRALADALTEAADLADAYDADPDAFNQREQAERATVPKQTAAAYAGQLEELQAALVLWRRQEHRIGPGPRARNLLAATCECGRRIRVAKATLSEAPILCGACQEPFEPAEPED